MFILNVLKTVIRILNKRQQYQLFMLSAFFIISAFVQIIGVASIAPFITLLSNPNIVFDEGFYSIAYQFVQADSPKQFTIWFAVVALCMIIISNVMSAVTLWLLFNFSVHVGANIQSNLFKNYLFREYLFHKSENYNKIISVIAQETPRFVYMVLQPFLLLLSQILVALVIIAGLIYISPSIAFSSAVLIGGAYLLTYVTVKRSLLQNGQIITDRNNKIQAILSESFIGIKDIKLNHTESKYINQLNKINFKGLRAHTVIVLTGDIPKFVMETISFGAILSLAIYALIRGDNTQELVAILSIYAIAGYKLLPTMQQIYKAISSISANGAVTNTLFHALNAKPSPQIECKPDFGEISPISEIVLENLHYQYPERNGVAGARIDDINLSFARGNLYTIAGPSGSGKSTLVDIILGLMPPTDGKILFNNTPLTDDKMYEYQKNIGYVAQNIFILDDTVIANITFGLDDQEIDLDRVKSALSKACALDFVEALPQGLYTPLGQDGKSLSGGQRQRIAIARALYHQRSALILDEPTSALDIESEHGIMSLLQQLKNDMLIIVVSHRPSAIRLSDKIILLENGTISTNGKFEELMETNTHFRQLMEKGFGENITQAENNILS